MNSDQDVKSVGTMHKGVVVVLSAEKRKVLGGVVGLLFARDPAGAACRECGGAPVSSVELVYPSLDNNMLCGACTEGRSMRDGEGALRTDCSQCLVCDAAGPATVMDFRHALAPRMVRAFVCSPRCSALLARVSQGLCDERRATAKPSVA